VLAAKQLILVIVIALISSSTLCTKDIVDALIG
jgi:hypothetical protein